MKTTMTLVMRTAGCLVGAAALTLIGTPAMARSSVALSINIGAPAPFYAAPAYVQPAPVYAPAPAYVSAYVGTPPVYVAPAYVAPVPRAAYPYYAPPPWPGHGRHLNHWGHGFRGDHHGWR